jgi:toluene monooxygenase system ferredoxin subunit
MAFKKICNLDDLWEGEMEAFEIDGHDVLVVWAEGGSPCAFQGTCPHQDIPLIEGKFEAGVVMCRAHQWTFDAKSGKGLNPADTCLSRYPIKIENGEVLVEVEGVQPSYAHP